MDASVPRDEKPKVSGLTLADVDRNLLNLTALAASRRRDLRSAVARVAALVGEAPDRVPLDLPEIAMTLAGINAAAAGITLKTLSNIRSDFLAAVRASELLSLPRPAKGALSAPWVELMAKLKDDHRARIGLSRLAHHASAAGMSPNEVNDAVIEQFIADVRKGTLHARPDRLHRRTAIIWNEAVRQQPVFNLQAVTVPAFGRTPKRVSWSKLPQSFRDDPASLEMAARARIAKSLERYVRSPRTSSIKGFASGARGGDILFHEECRRRMIDTVIVIPFAPDVFIQTSVALGTDSDNWPKRFWQLWNGTPPEQRHVLSLEASNNAYTVCNIRLLELAAQHGRVHLIALWDGKAGDGPGGTADLISKVKAEDEPDIFSPESLSPHLAP